MTRSSTESAWQSISRRKRADQESALHSPSTISVRVPSNLLPKDPPQAKDGPQPVHQIPDTLLSDQDVRITSLSLPALLSEIHTGKLTTTAVTQAFIRRASLAQQLTNCLTEPLFVRALDRASNLDHHFTTTSGSPRLVGPLHGLPVSIKDTFNVEDVDSSIGLTALAYKPAAADSPLVQLLESLGCVIIAKTNIPQTLASLDSINHIFGRTYNPFNRLLTAGGSSGGEGVLVAMRGSAIGFGTDIGGSIRIPAMCNALYGFKPSEGRVPYGGQGLTGLEGISRASVQAVAGPIAHSPGDIALVMREVTRISALYGADCLPVPLPWSLDSSRLVGSGSKGTFNVGILGSDNNCTLLPPIRNVIREVAETLRQNAQNLNIVVVPLPTPKAWTKAQSVMSKLMGVDGGAELSKMLQSTSEPLVPWMATRFKHDGKHAPLARVADLQVQRARLQQEMIRDVWCYGSTSNDQRERRIDALICPIAPHPTPEIEAWNAVGYTSSWVLFDYPAGVIPVRVIDEADLELGQNSLDSEKVLGSWDEKCRDLWDENKVNRKVYLGGTLGIQVVGGRLEDEKVVGLMRVLEGVLQKNRVGSKL